MGWTALPAPSPAGQFSPASAPGPVPPARPARTEPSSGELRPVQWPAPPRRLGVPPLPAPPLLCRPFPRSRDPARPDVPLGPPETSFLLEPLLPLRARFPAGSPVPNTLPGPPVDRTFLPPELRGTGQAQPVVLREQSVRRSPARGQFRVCTGGRVPLRPAEGGEAEEDGGPYHSPPQGYRVAPSRALKGGADLGRQAATHTPIGVGVGTRWGAQGQPSAAACQGCANRF